MMEEPAVKYLLQLVDDKLFRPMIVSLVEYFEKTFGISYSTLVRIITMDSMMKLFE